MTPATPEIYTTFPTLSLHAALPVSGLVGRPAGGDAADEDVAAHLLRVEAEPGARRLRGAALAQQIGHDRLQRRDRHEHVARKLPARRRSRSEEHTSELQSLMRNSYAVFCLNKKNTRTRTRSLTTIVSHTP